MDPFNEPWIETTGGREFTFLNPKPDQIEISEIAWSLANQCRFTGHTKRYYSVAEHSVLVATMLDRTKHSLQGLLHDAAEAYVGDIASPLKQQLPEYKVIEDGIQKAIYSKYHCVSNTQHEVKDADIEMLSIEAFYLMPNKGNNWTMWERVNRPAIRPDFAPLYLKPAQAFNLFMEAFYRYSGVKKETPTLIIPESGRANEQNLQRTN